MADGMVHKGGLPWGMEWGATAMTARMLQLSTAVMDICGIVQPPDAVNINLYVSGQKRVGWHADDEPILDSIAHDATIVSLSLGQRRAFKIRKKKGKQAVATVHLGDGDI